jgi:FkbM family methyltransferase
MPSVSGWLAQLPSRARAVRGGLHPVSALKIAAGRHDDVRLRGVRLAGPSARGVANTAVEIAAGEYAARGFEIVAGERVVDCGANVGAFAVWAAAVGASVDAYEPHPLTFDWLERNTAGLAVRCVRAAVVAAAPPGGMVALGVDPGADTHHSLGGAGATIDVPAVSLEAAIGAGCDLLKLDCEGAEFELIAETPGETLRRARRIACEIHDWIGDPTVIERRLRDLGYSVDRAEKGNGLSVLFARRGERSREGRG